MTTLEGVTCRIREIAAHEGGEVVLRGWMFNKRSSRTLQFLQLRDGSGMIQGVVAQEQVDPATWQAAAGLQMECSLAVRGTVRKDARAPSGYELDVRAIAPLGGSPEYPISKKDHGPDFLLDRRHLWLRSRRQWAIMRVRSVVIKACRDFFDERGFVLIDAPVFTPSACEGTTNLFETKYFDTQVYLTQSGQLYMEAAAMAHGQVYCFGPAFRAEKSKTRRHLTEFWMIEPEVAFLEWRENMDLQEALVCFVVGRVLERCRTELALLERDATKLEAVKAPFPRISYSEGIEVLKGKGVTIAFGDDFGGDEETILSQCYDRPVFVHHYPSALKAFYMKRDPADERLALGNDLLAPEGYGEIIGAGQREDNLDALVARIKEHSLPMEAFEWYLDLRRFGSVPHAGFGMGVERVLAWICGLQHVRETIPFPRMMYRTGP